MNRILFHKILCNIIMDSQTVCVYICYPSFYLAKIYTVHVCTMVHKGPKTLQYSKIISEKFSLIYFYIWIITLLPKHLTFSYLILNCKQFTKLYILLTCQQIGVNTFYKCIEFQVNSFDIYWEILILLKKYP
jgi:hypothetical protein